MKASIQELSQSGTHINNPYHNYKHCNDVTTWCEKILLHEGITQLSPELLWAALFHDYNHSGGLLPDSENIKNARIGLTVKYKHYTQGYAFQFQTGYVLAKAHEIIDCTLFDNGFPNTPRSLDQQVIRDADLMSVFLPLEESLVMCNGLYQELLVKQPLLTKQDYWSKNVEFLSNVTWFTSYGKLLSKSLPEKLKELESVFLVN